MKRFLAVLMVATLLIGLVPMTAASAISQYATVVGGWLRLRASASFSADTIDSFYTGTQVKILSSSGSWYRVEVPDGRTGYMYGSYLSFGGYVPPDDDQGAATVTSQNGLGVRLRKGPGTGYRILRVYPVGTRATVLYRGSYWSKLSINGTVGYMMNRFLNFGGGGGGGVTPGANAVIWSRNGYGVRLRTGPGTWYSIIGVYSVGTGVYVMEQGPVWCKIQVGSRVGYMMTEFLNIWKPTVVSAVSLNLTQPILGDTLKVNSLTPSDAKVDYSWSVGGIEVGTDGQLWLNPADSALYENQIVTLRVSGKDGFTGSAIASTQPVWASKISLTSATLNNLTPALNDVMNVAVEPKNATYQCAWSVDGTGYTSTGPSLALTNASFANHTVTVKVTGTGLYTGTISQTTTSPVADTGTITAAAITNVTLPGAVTPNVGHTLRADITPDTTQATCQWYLVNPTTLAETALTNARQFVVPATAAGMKIKLHVTGTGKYSASAPIDQTTDIVANNAYITGLALAPLSNLRFTKGTGSSSDVGTTLTATVSWKSATAITNVLDTFAFTWTRDDGTVVADPTTLNSNTYTVQEGDVGHKISVSVVAKDITAWTADTFQKTTTEIVKGKLTNAQLLVNGVVAGTAKIGDTVTVALDPTAASSVVAWYVNTQMRTTGASYTINAADVHQRLVGQLKAIVTASEPYVGNITVTLKIEPDINGSLTTVVLGVMMDEKGQPVTSEMLAAANGETTTETETADGAGTGETGTTTDGTVTDGTTTDGTVTDGTGTNGTSDGSAGTGEAGTTTDGSVTDGTGTDGSGTDGTGANGINDGSAGTGETGTTTDDTVTDETVTDGSGTDGTGANGINDGSAGTGETGTEAGGTVTDGSGVDGTGTDGETQHESSSGPDASQSETEQGNAPTEALSTGHSSVSSLEIVKNGTTLTTVLTSERAAVGYRWYRGTTEIVDETRATYAITEADWGHTIKAEVTLDDGSIVTQQIALKQQTTTETTDQNTTVDTPAQNTSLDATEQHIIPDDTMTRGITQALPEGYTEFSMGTNAEDYSFNNNYQP